MLHAILARNLSHPWVISDKKYLIRRDKEHPTAQGIALNDTDVAFKGFWNCENCQHKNTTEN
jgi:hypothetical protein